MKHRSILCTLAAILALGPAPVLEATPNLVSYQGVLTNTAGELLAIGEATSYDVTFSIYNVPEGGDAIWEEKHKITILDGNFSTILGAGTGVAVGNPAEVAALADILNTDGDLYLEVMLPSGQEEVTNDLIFKPRQQLVSGLYAIRAGTADSVRDGAITHGMIKDGAVTGGKDGTIADGSITEDDIGEGAVGAVEIEDGAVSGGKDGIIADGSITKDDIGENAVGADQIADGAVSGGKDGTIADGSITGDDIHESAITSAKIANGTITGDDIDSVPWSKITIPNTIGEAPNPITNLKAGNNITAGNALILGENLWTIQNEEVRGIGGAVTDSLVFKYNGGVVFRFHQNGIGVTTGTPGEISWAQRRTFSDRQLKNGVQKIEGTLARALQLNPVNFSWKDEWKESLSDREQTGFVAQEVEKIFPNLVLQVTDEYKGLQYDRFGVIAIAALQEMHAAERADSAAKAEKIAALEKENETLKERLDRVEAFIRDQGADTPQ